MYNSALALEILNYLKDKKIIHLNDINLIKGLIVLSNHYLEELEYLEDVKKVKTKLEKAIKKGVEVKVEKFCEDSMHMVVRINGNNKYNFYGPTFADLFSLAEMRNSMLCSDLDRVNL